MRRLGCFLSFLEIWKNIMRYSNSSRKRSSSCHLLSRCTNSWNSSKCHKYNLMKSMKEINRRVWDIWSSSRLSIWMSRNRRWKRWRLRTNSRGVRMSMLGLKKYSKSKSIFSLLDKVVSHLSKIRISTDLKGSTSRILESWMEVEKKK